MSMDRLCSRRTTGFSSIASMPMMRSIRSERRSTLIAFHGSKPASARPAAGPPPPYASIGAETPPPQLVIQNDDAVSARLLVLGQEAASQRGRDAQRVEERRRDLPGGDALRF